MHADFQRVESLLTIADELLQASKPEDRRHMAKDILPSRQSWEEALAPFLELPPRRSTAITSPLGGIVHLVDNELPEIFQKRWESIPRDADNCSSALRLAFFTTRILSLDIIQHIDTEGLETLFYNLPLALQLIDDDLSIENCNGITGLGLPEQREEYMEVVNDGRKVISEWIHSDSRTSSGGTVSSMLSTFWEQKLERLDATSPVDYRVGEAFVKIMASVGSSTKSSEDIAKLCKDTRTANAIRSAAWLTTLRHSIISNPAGTRLCNELVADSTGLNPQDEQQAGAYSQYILLHLAADMIQDFGSWHSSTF